MLLINCLAWRKKNHVNAKRLVHKDKGSENACNSYREGRCSWCEKQNRVKGPLIVKVANLCQIMPDTNVLYLFLFLFVPAHRAPLLLDVPTNP